MVRLVKNQIFYKQYFYMNLLDTHYKNRESDWIVTMLEFGDELLHHVAGYLYRIKKFRTQQEVIDYLLWVYSGEETGRIFELDIKFRNSHLPFIKKLINLYE